MCVCPISVRNKKLDFDPLIDRFYNFVPCGHCYECQESIRNGYEVRLMFEFFHNKKIHGNTYYFTLTYNENSCPVIPGTSIRCFSKRHLQLFFKRLRKYLPKFKYFVASEFGHKTFRPHYHGLLFFDSRVNYLIVNSFIKKCWNYGFVDFSLNHGLVTDIRPMSYVSKYCTKDVAFENRLKSFSSLTPVVNYLSNKRDFDVDLYPFHLQSQYLGYDIIRYLRDEDYVKGYFVCNDILGINRKLAIPLYILRLKLYDRYVNSNNTISYRLNQYGKEIFYKKMVYQYRKLSDNYNLLFSIGKNISIYNKSIFIKRYFTFEQWCSLCDRFLSDGSYSIVAYKLLYHDTYDVPFSFEDFYTDLEIYYKSVLSPHWFNYACSEKYHVPYEDENKILLDCLSDVSSYYKYLKYIENIKRLNTAQLHRKLRTGKYKPKYICTFDEYRNNHNLNYFYHVRLLKEKEDLPNGELWPMQTSNFSASN